MRRRDFREEGWKQETKLKQATAVTYTRVTVAWIRVPAADESEAVTL